MEQMGYHKACVLPSVVGGFSISSVTSRASGLHSLLASGPALNTAEIFLQFCIKKQEMSVIGTVTGKPSLVLVGQYYILASSAAVYYDFALTLPQEIKHIWSSKFSLMNVLLTALRYTTAIGYVPIIWLTLSPISSKACEKFGKLPGILGIICQGLTLAFLIVRLFAIYDKRRWILYSAIPFGVMNIVLSSLALADAEANPTFDLQVPGSTRIVNLEQFHPSSCFVAPVLSSQLLRYELSYFANILFDTWIFILSIVRLGRTYRTKRLFHSESSIVNILLRDGCILYANAVNFIAFMLVFREDASPDVPNRHVFLFVVSSGTNSELTHAFSAIFVSRMVFNLREAGTEIYEGTQEWHSRIERASRPMHWRCIDPTEQTIREGQFNLLDDTESAGADVDNLAHEKGLA